MSTRQRFWGNAAWVAIATVLALLVYGSTAEATSRPRSFFQQEHEDTLQVQLDSLQVQGDRSATILASVGVALDDSVQVVLDSLQVLGPRLALMEVDVDAILVDTGTTIPATITTLQDSANVVLDSLQVQGGRLATIDDIADQILVDTGTTIPGTITTLQTAVDEGVDSLQAVGPRLALMEVDIDAILLDTGTTLDGKINTIDGYHDVPTADAATNSQMRDVVGSKNDDGVWDGKNDPSIDALLKGLAEQRGFVHMGRVGLFEEFSWGAHGDTVKTSVPVLPNGAAMWAAYQTGTATSVAINRNGAVFPTQMRIDAGTAATGSAGILSEAGLYTTPYDSDVDSVFFEARLKAESVGTSIQTMWGLTSLTGSVVHATHIATGHDMAAFTSVANADSTLTYDNNGATQERTIVAGSVDQTAWHTYKIVWTTTSARFYVDGTLKNTHSTTVPTLALYPFFICNTTASAQRYMDVDYVKVWTE